MIVGIGNDMKGDDGVGIYIASKLQALKIHAAGRTHIMIGGTTPENLTGAIKKIKPSHILLIDAADMGMEPGDVKVLDPKNITGISFSTHSFSISAISEYLERETGAETMVLGIQPKILEFGSGMSPEIKDRADSIAGQIAFLL